MTKRLQHLKRLIVLMVAMVAISLNISAQEWYIYGVYTWSAPHPVGDFYEHHYQGESVTVGGLEYHTIYVRNEDNQTHLDGAYRNEDNQVYYRRWNGTAYGNEELLYDYDLEQGDFFHDDDEHPMQVTEVSTITDGMGVARKKITFSFIGLPDVTEFWVEGVGSSRGFMHVGMWEADHDSDGEMYNMLCYHVNNSVIYVNPEYNTCEIDEVIENKIDSISVYPNPASHSVKILNDGGMNITGIQIIDLTGRVVLSSERYDSIDISSLPEGQYFLKIIGDRTIVKKLSVLK